MREIKFRAWDATRKVMLNPAMPIITGKGMYWMTSGELCWDMLGVDEYALMQFTGLLDKNGVEIYEGDLCADKDSIVQIVWSENHQWGCKIVKTKYILEKDLTFPLWQWDRCEKNGNRELEVIGNIHKNPGLLEKQPCG